MDVPTPTRARTLSPLLEETYPSPENDEVLEAWLAVAARLVASLTCRVIGNATGDEMEAVPTDLEPLAERAIVMKAERLSRTSGTAAARSRALGRGNLQSISAGPWSESYFGPDAAAKAKKLDTDPDLADMLWALATQSCRDAWLYIWDGTLAPAAAPIAFEYSARPGGGSRSVLGPSEYL